MEIKSTVRNTAQPVGDRSLQDRGTGRQRRGETAILVHALFTGVYNGAASWESSLAVPQSAERGFR